MASLNFNANNVEPLDEFDPLPNDDYVAVITASEMKPTKNGQGSYLELTFQVIEGQYKGRLVWARLNLENANPMAVKISQAHLAAICKAVNVIAPRDSVELHNLPLVIKVACKKREDNDELTNEIKSYKPRSAIASQSASSVSPSSPHSPPSPAPSATAASTSSTARRSSTAQGSPVWGRK